MLVTMTSIFVVIISSVTITTLGAYRDFHLVIEFKWGQKTWGKRESRSRDSGILVHCFGPQGTVGGNWMASIEAQIIEGGVGDILVLAPKLADGTVLETSLSAEVGLDRDKEKVWTARMTSSRPSASGPVSR